MSKEIRGARAPGPFTFTVGGRTFRGTFWNGKGGGAKFESDDEILTIGLVMDDPNGTPEICFTAKKVCKPSARYEGGVDRAERSIPLAKLRTVGPTPLRPPTGRNGTRRTTP